MPLSPLPPSNTKRYFVHWTIGTTSHHTTVRAASSVTDADTVTNLRADWTGLLPALGNNVVIDGLEVALQGSDIRNPVAGWTVLTGTGAVPCAGQDLARSFSLRGRSTTGRKVRMLLWGFIRAEQPDFELALGDQIAAESGFQTIVASRASWYLAIDGTKPIWRTNYLEDYNDHWQRELRP